MRFEGAGSGESYRHCPDLYCCWIVFLHQYLSIQEHCVPKVDPIVSFLVEERIVCRGSVLFMYSSQEGIKPYSRNS